MMRQVKIMSGWTQCRGAVAAALLLALLAGDVCSQAWLQPKGGYYFKVSGSYLDTDTEFNFTGDRQDVFADDESLSETSFSEFSLTTYFEYGLLDHLTLVASLPIKRITSEETSSLGPLLPDARVERTSAGPSDLVVSARVPSPLRYLSPLWYLFGDRAAFALQGGVKIPLGYDENPEKNDLPLPPLGTGKVDFEIHETAGLSLYPLPAYLSAGIGFRVRGGELNDEWIFNAEAGYTAGPVFLKLRFDGLQNTIPPPNLSGSTFTSFSAGTTVGDIVAGDQDVLKLNPAVAYYVTERFAVNAEVFHVLEGKNTVAGTSFVLGLVYEGK
jgi:hypothetical protein